MSLHEELYGECLEREDARVKDYAEADNVPVRKSKVEQLTQHNFVRFPGSSQFVVAFGVVFQSPVNNCTHNAKSADSNSDQEWVAPVVECCMRPRGRVQ